MFKKISLLICLFLITVSIHAAPVTWVLEDVIFDDGAIATGSFVFDADINTVLDFDISVSGGDEGVLPAFTYTPETVLGINAYNAVPEGVSI